MRTDSLMFDLDYNKLYYWESGPSVDKYKIASEASILYTLQKRRKKMLFTTITLLSPLHIPYALATHILKDLRDKHAYASSQL